MDTVDSVDTVVWKLNFVPFQRHLCKIGFLFGHAHRRPTSGVLLLSAVVFNSQFGQIFSVGLSAV